MELLENKELQDQLSKIGVSLLKIEFTEEEELKIQGWREGIEEYGQELWNIYHWIISAQDGSTHGIYRLGNWLEHFNVPDNTNGEHWPKLED